MSPSPLEPAENSRYCDPQASIVLKSNEGLEFRVHEYFARKTCGLFDDLASLPHLTAEAIEIDATALQLRMFLDAMYTYDMPSVILTFGYKLHQSAAVLAGIADFLQAPSILTTFITALMTLGKYDGIRGAWLAFGLAARSGNLRLARDALRTLQYVDVATTDYGMGIEKEWLEPPYRPLIVPTYAEELTRLLALPEIKLSPSSINFKSVVITIETHHPAHCPKPRKIKRARPDDADASEEKWVMDLPQAKKSAAEVAATLIDWQKLAEAFDP